MVLETIGPVHILCLPILLVYMLFFCFVFFCNFLRHTLETLVYSGGEGVSQHHHGGVDDDFSAPALGPHHFPLASTAVQFQHHFIVMAIKEDLVPFAVVQAVGGQREVVVTIAQIVGDTEEALEDLGLEKTWTSYFDMMIKNSLNLSVNINH